MSNHIPAYCLYIHAVDGSAYALASDDKKQLWGFLNTYDHEGSTVTLAKRIADTDKFQDFDYEGIYNELRER